MTSLLAVITFLRQAFHSVGHAVTISLAVLIMLYQAFDPAAAISMAVLNMLYQTYDRVNLIIHYTNLYCCNTTKVKQWHSVDPAGAISLAVLAVLIMLCQAFDSVDPTAAISLSMTVLTMLYQVFGGFDPAAASTWQCWPFCIHRHVTRGGLCVCVGGVGGGGFFTIE